VSDEFRVKLLVSLAQIRIISDCQATEGSDVNKNDLVKKVAKHCCGKPEARKVLEATFDHITHALSQGEKVVLSGFGSFHVYERKEKRAAHPRRPSEIIIIPAMKCVRFIPGKVVKGNLKS